jgi:hypothetical protein
VWSLFLLSVASFTSKTQIFTKFDIRNFYYSCSLFGFLSWLIDTDEITDISILFYFVLLYSLLLSAVTAMSLIILAKLAFCPQNELHCNMIHIVRALMLLLFSVSLWLWIIMHDILCITVFICVCLFLSLFDDVCMNWNCYTVYFQFKLLF